VTPDDSDADGAARSRHLEELGDAEDKRLDAIQRTSGRQDWPD
jgi:hypothetical protein